MITFLILCAVVYFIFFNSSSDSTKTKATSPVCSQETHIRSDNTNSDPVDKSDDYLIRVPNNHDVKPAGVLETDSHKKRYIMSHIMGPVASGSLGSRLLSEEVSEREVLREKLAEKFKCPHEGKIHVSIEEGLLFSKLWDRDLNLFLDFAVRAETSRVETVYLNCVVDCGNGIELHFCPDESHGFGRHLTYSPSISIYNRDHVMVSDYLEGDAISAFKVSSYLARLFYDLSEYRINFILNGRGITSIDYVGWIVKALASKQ